MKRAALPKSALYGLFLLLFLGNQALAQRPVARLFNNEMELPASLKAYVDKGTVCQLNPSAIAELFRTRPSSLTLQFSFEGKEWQLDLESNDVFSKGFFVKDGGGKPVAYDPSSVLYYKGNIHGDEKTVAAISILKDEVMGVLADRSGNINIGALAGTGSQKEHIIFREQDIKQRQVFACEVLAAPNPLPNFNAPLSTQAAINTEPVDVYFEADYSCYQNNGSSITNTVNWATAVFNVVTTLYDNDSVYVKMSGIKVWNIADPYLSYSTTANVLYAFSANMNTAGIPGDLAHLLSQRGLGGGIAWLNVLCAGPYNRCAVSGNLSNAFNQLPSYSWSTMVITHEMGHNLASNHTQWCGWPGGAIDNCYTTEGGCPQGPAPINGGTIMSYCHLTGYGINLMNGFGPLPGAAIRNAVRTSTCIYPRISFGSSFQTVTEEDADSNNNCLDYKVITVRLGINYTPTQPAIISLLPSALASPGLVIGTNQDVAVSPLNFTLTDTTAQIIQLKVYNDAFIENKESLKIDYTVAANGTDALKNGTYQLDILSLDHRPDSTVNQLLFFEPFDSIPSGLGAWTQTVVYGATAPNRWIIANNIDSVFSNKAACISFNGSNAGYSGSSLADSSVIRLESPSLNASGFSSMRLSYLYKCNGEGTPGGQGSGGGTGLDFGKVYYSTNNGATWTLLRDNIFGRNFKTSDEMNLPAAANNSPTLKIAFEWRNNSSIVNNPPLIIDSIVIRGTGSSPVQSAADAANSDEAPLGPNQTVHYYNPVTKNIMATIVNKSSWDFGCSKVELVRTGNSASGAWGNYAGQMIADKSYKVTVANNDPNAIYEITLYYTNQEINGWAAATGNSATDIAIVKTAADITQSPPVTSPQFSNYNSVANYAAPNNKKITGSFAGFSTFSLAKAGISPACPAGMQQLSANEIGSAYQWQVNNGSGYSNVVNDAIYAGAASGTLTLTNAPTSWYGYQYRCFITDAQGSHYSIEYSLKFAVEWAGSVSDAWENPANWSCSVLPDYNTDVFVKSGANFYPLVNANATIRSLKVQNGAMVTLKNGVVLTVTK